MRKLTPMAAAAGLLWLVAVPAQATVIDFTGGTVTRLDTSTATTNNAVSYDNVDYYEEGGFRLDFTPNAGSTGFATHVGDYYLVGNDVIHSHWALGHYGGVDSVEITKIGGGTFDLNYFILTSNTMTGGSFASGSELAYVEGFNSNVSTGAPVLLPSQDWGFGTGGPFPGVSQIFLGSAFDNVDLVKFYVTNAVDCFGMDEFYIDEAAPGTVPEPSTLVLFGSALASLAVYRKRSQKA